MSVWDNVKEMKAWIMGAIAFDAAITGLLVAVFNVDTVKTTIATTATTLMALAIVWLIYRSEKRTSLALKDHIEEAQADVKQLTTGIDELKTLIKENGKSTLRLEINEEMLQNPHNHDTILKMGEKYFCDMDGDWYMTNRFLDWVEKENIHLPPTLMGLKRD